MRPRSAPLMLLLAVPVLSPRPVSAQSTTHWAAGGAATATLFVGDADILDGALGLDLWGARRLTSWLSLRADALLMDLTAQTNLGERADNRILAFGAGPEVEASLGLLAPYARLFIGIAFNDQIRRGSQARERGSSASLRGAAGGLRVRVGDAWWLDLGVGLAKLGDLDFARTSDAVAPLIEDPVGLRAHAGVSWSPSFGAR